MFVSLKKARLQNGLFGLAKIDQHEADEPVALLSAQRDPFSQPQRNRR